MNKAYLFLGIIVLFLNSCASNINNIKTDDNIGEKVIVSGTVKQSIKLGELSGFVIEDETDSIKVSSESLPEEGEDVKVKGTLLKDTIFGYYIQRE